MTNISIEYSQLKLSEKILNDLKNEVCGKNSKCSYEMENILERLLICTSNYYKIHKWSTVFYPIDFRHSCVKQMNKELNEKSDLFNKTFKNKKDRELYINNIIREIIIEPIYNFLSGPIPTGIKTNPLIFDKECIRFNDIQVKLPQNKIEQLKLYNEHDVILMLLRYKSHLIKSQQWGIPEDVYKDLYNRYNARYEGFASPLNSRMMDLEGGYFCSLFVDVDKPFGSLGNFFELNLINPLNNKKVPQKVVFILNPPFIEDFITKSIEYVDHYMKEAQKSDTQFIVFGIIPAWFDSEFHKLIKLSEYLAYYKILERNTYYYKNYNHQIIANFKSVVYVLDSHIKKKHQNYANCFRKIMV